MSISEIINVSISETQAGTVLESFDKLAILAAAADTTPTSYAGAEAMEYSADVPGLAAIATDWGIGSDTYKAALAAVSQEPRCDSLYIISRDAPVATQKTVVITGALLTGQTVHLTVNGQTFTALYATSSDATLTAFAATIQAGANGVATATNVSGTITIVATSEYALTVGTATVTGSGTQPTFVTATTVAGRTAADDIADALAEDDTNKWYGLVAADANKGLQLAVAAAIEVTEKFFWLRTSESASKTAGGTTALGIQLAALNYRRTLWIWHHDTTEFIDAAAFAYYLGNDPGSIDLAHTQLVGITASKTADLTAAQVTVVEGRNGNTYRKFGQFSLLRQGKRADGVVAESTRDLDYARNEFRAAGLVYVSQNKKPPYDDPGGSAIRSLLEQNLRRLVKEGVFRGDQPATVYVPLMKDISAGNQALQKWPGCKVSATLLKGTLEIDIPLEITV